MKLEMDMATARLFNSGNSQAVRIPKQFRMKGREVEICRVPEGLLLREKTAGMLHVLDLISEIPEDVFPKKRKDPKPERRKGL
jgi:antitoxin VapB